MKKETRISQCNYPEKKKAKFSSHFTENKEKNKEIFSRIKNYNIKLIFIKEAIIIFHLLIFSIFFVISGENIKEMNLLYNILL